MRLRLPPPSLPALCSHPTARARDLLTPKSIPYPRDPCSKPRPPNYQPSSNRIPIPRPIIHHCRLVTLTCCSNLIKYQSYTISSRPFLLGFYSPAIWSFQEPFLRFEIPKLLRMELARQGNWCLQQYSTFPSYTLPRSVASAEQLVCPG